MSTVTVTDWNPTTFERLAGVTDAGEDSMDDATFRAELVKLAKNPQPALPDPDAWMYDLTDDEFEAMLAGGRQAIEMAYLLHA